MRHILTLLLLCSFAAAQLPDAPKPRLIDWEFITIHSVYAGALTFDLRNTAVGVSNGCQEASSNLGPFPSTKKIVANGLIEFGLVTAGDLGLKALGRHLGVPRWLQISIGSVGADIGTFKHTRGGLAWTRTNCL